MLLHISRPDRESLHRQKKKCVGHVHVCQACMTKPSIRRCRWLAVQMWLQEYLSQWDLRRGRIHGLQKREATNTQLHHVHTRGIEVRDFQWKYRGCTTPSSEVNTPWCFFLCWFLAAGRGHPPMIGVVKIDPKHPSSNYYCNASFSSQQAIMYSMTQQ